MATRIDDVLPELPRLSGNDARRVAMRNALLEVGAYTVTEPTGAVVYDRGEVVPPWRAWRRDT